MTRRAAGGGCWHHLPDWWSVFSRKFEDGRPHRAGFAVAWLHAVVLHPGGWLPDVLRPHRALRRELGQTRREVLRLELRLSLLMREIGVMDAEARAHFPTLEEIEERARQRRKDRLALIPGGAL